MRNRIGRLSAAAALAAAAIVAVTGAATAHARVCTPGRAGYASNYGPPGSAAAWWTTGVGGCYQLNVRIKSADGFYYDSGWIADTAANVTGQVQTATNTCVPHNTCPGGDGSPLEKAWLQERETSDHAVARCKRIDISGNWFNCPDPSARGRR